MLDALRARGYRTIGPRIVDGAVVYRDLDRPTNCRSATSIARTAASIGSKRLDNAGHFDYVVGPDSLKKYLFPPRETLLESIRTNGKWQMTPPAVEPPPLAVIGLRSCDLHALAIQDKVFLGGPYVDPGYQARRQNLFIVAVNCRRAAATCFCHSMNTGPTRRRRFRSGAHGIGRPFRR